MVVEFFLGMGECSKWLNKVGGGAIHPPLATIRRTPNRLSLASCAPAELASVSPANAYLAKRNERRQVFERPDAEVSSVFSLSVVFDPVRRRLFFPALPVCLSASHIQWRYEVAPCCNDRHTLSPRSAHQPARAAFFCGGTRP